MDNQQSSEVPTQPAAATPAPAPKRRFRSLKLLLILILLLCLLAAAAIAYLWHEDQLNRQTSEDVAKIATLQEQIRTLEKKVSDSSATDTVPTTDSTTKQRATIVAAVSSGNTAAIESYMAATVRVIIAASSGVGDRTPTQAVQDLNYVTGATGPWNFALDTATLDGYARGDYAAYFHADSVVGKAADGHVVVFNFDSSNKISGIFMAIKDDLL